MQVWTEIRRKVLVKKVPKRQICRNYNISFHTLAKMLENVKTVKIVAQGHLVATHARSWDQASHFVTPTAVTLGSVATS